MQITVDIKYVEYLLNIYFMWVIFSLQKLTLCTLTLEITL